MLTEDYIDNLLCSLISCLLYTSLSALMTTTLKSMSDTIEALRKSGHDCKIVVGGAVLTEDYAKKIGADCYAKDAKQTVDFAKEILG